jgi:hypothetical protein
MRSIEELYKERLRICIECQDNWDYGIDQICKEIIENHFKNDVDTAISIINNWSRDYIWYFSEYFEDFITALPSKRLLNCFIEISHKFPDIDLEQEIYWSKNAYESSNNIID